MAIRTLILRSKTHYSIIEVPSNGKPIWYGGAYCLYFIYTRDNGNFILKGFQQEVGEFLKKNYDHYFFYASMWHDGKPRGYWHFWKEGVYMCEPNRRLKKYKYQVVRYKHTFHSSKEDIELSFKRMPKCWIPEFNKF